MTPCVSCGACQLVPRAIGTPERREVVRRDQLRGQLLGPLFHSRCDLGWRPRRRCTPATSLSIAQPDEEWIGKSGLGLSEPGRVDKTSWPGSATGSDLKRTYPRRRTSRGPVPFPARCTQSASWLSAVLARALSRCAVQAYRGCRTRPSLPQLRKGPAGCTEVPGHGLIGRSNVRTANSSRSRSASPP